jgi:arylsulfatase A-like enzyme
MCRTLAPLFDRLHFIFKPCLKFAFCLSLLFASFVVPAQQPNIIFIMTDDMGYGDLSCYGQKNYNTPNLDKLASQGMKFVNAYSAGAVCTPTRAAFMTGSYPGRTTVGLIEPLTGSKEDLAVGLTPAIPSLALRMKNAGYATALIGKWHLGELPEHSPNKNGFEYFFGFHAGAADYISHKNPNGKPDLYENESAILRDGYLTEVFATKAIDFLKQKHQKPFFLALMFNAPHWPWQRPADSAYPDSADFRNGGSAPIFAEMMKSLDNNIGKVMSTLDAEQLSNETIVIFTNDNGGERYSDQAGLSKRKGSLWEGGIRVPAFVRWPGKIKAGLVTEQVVITMDWTATILSLGKANALPATTGDGVDLTPVLTGKTATIERTLYWRTSQRSKQKAVRAGDWKYLQDNSGEYLFNLRSDPGEKTDRKQEHTDIIEQMKKQYATWEKGMLPAASL